MHKIKKNYFHIKFVDNIKSMLTCISRAHIIFSDQ